jgi:hypothetical protein
MTLLNLPKEALNSVADQCSLGNATFAREGRDSLGLFVTEINRERCSLATNSVRSFGLCGCFSHLSLTFSNFYA